MMELVIDGVAQPTTRPKALTRASPAGEELPRRSGSKLTEVGAYVNFAVPTYSPKTRSSHEYDEMGIDCVPAVAADRLW